MKKRTTLLASVLALAVVAQASAAIFVQSIGDREATAEFELAGGNLQVTLTNSSLADVLVPVDVLTAVFFDVAGDPALTRESAVLAPGSAVYLGGVQVNVPGGVVGGEWAYLSGLSGMPGGASQGISSTGLDTFGPHDRFPGDNLDGPQSPNGLSYGITSAGDDFTTGNGGTDVVLVQNSVVLTLGGLPQGFDIDDVCNVHFLYGTDLSEALIIPEPASLLVWSLLAVIGLAIGWHRRRKPAA
ncbi:MAG: hypothetical protein JXB62_21670 [Pirellulales bacterium]|nr:hypothetical protein [Pirellulales bacterium]